MHILDFFAWADMEERCEQFVNFLIEDYNQNLEKFIDERIEMIRTL